MCSPRAGVDDYEYDGDGEDYGVNNGAGAEPVGSERPGGRGEREHQQQAKAPVALEQVVRVVNQSATLSCREHYLMLAEAERRQYSSRLVWHVSRGHTVSRLEPSLFQVCSSEHSYTL